MLSAWRLSAFWLMVSTVALLLVTRKSVSKDQPQNWLCFVFACLGCALNLIGSGQVNNVAGAIAFFATSAGYAGLIYRYGSTMCKALCVPEPKWLRLSLSLNLAFFSSLGVSVVLLFLLETATKSSYSWALLVSAAVLRIIVPSFLVLLLLALELKLYYIQRKTLLELQNKGLGAFLANHQQTVNGASPSQAPSSRRHLHLALEQLSPDAIEQRILWLGLFHLVLVAAVAVGLWLAITEFISWIHGFPEPPFPLVWDKIFFCAYEGSHCSPLMFLLFPVVWLGIWIMYEPNGVGSHPPPLTRATSKSGLSRISTPISRPSKLPSPLLGAMGGPMVNAATNPQASRKTTPSPATQAKGFPTLRQLAHLGISLVWKMEVLLLPSMENENGNEAYWRAIAVTRLSLFVGLTSLIFLADARFDIGVLIALSVACVTFQLLYKKEFLTLSLYAFLLATCIYTAFIYVGLAGPRYLVLYFGGSSLFLATWLSGDSHFAWLSLISYFASLAFLAGIHGWLDTTSTEPIGAFVGHSLMSNLICAIYVYGWYQAANDHSKLKILLSNKLGAKTSKVMTPTLVLTPQSARKKLTGATPHLEVHVDGLDLHHLHEERLRNGVENRVKAMPDVYPRLIERPSLLSWQHTPIMTSSSDLLFMKNGRTGGGGWPAPISPRSDDGHDTHTPTHSASPPNSSPPRVEARHVKQLGVVISSQEHDDAVVSPRGHDDGKELATQRSSDVHAAIPFDATPSDTPVVEVVEYAMPIRGGWRRNEDGELVSLSRESEYLKARRHTAVMTHEGQASTPSAHPQAVMHAEARAGWQANSPTSQSQTHIHAEGMQSSSPTARSQNHPQTEGPPQHLRNSSGDVSLSQDSSFLLQRRAELVYNNADSTCVVEERTPMHTPMVQVEEPRNSKDKVEVSLSHESEYQRLRQGHISMLDRSRSTSTSYKIHSSIHSSEHEQDAVPDHANETEESGDHGEFPRSRERSPISREISLRAREVQAFPRSRESRESSPRAREVQARRWLEVAKLRHNQSHSREEDDSSRRLEVGEVQKSRQSELSSYPRDRPRTLSSQSGEIQMQGNFLSALPWLEVGENQSQLSSYPRDRPRTLGSYSDGATDIKHQRQRKSSDSTSPLPRDPAEVSLSNWSFYAQQRENRKHANGPIPIDETQSSMSNLTTGTGGSTSHLALGGGGSHSYLSVTTPITPKHSKSSSSVSRTSEPPSRGPSASHITRSSPTLAHHHLVRVLTTTDYEHRPDSRSPSRVLNEHRPDSRSPTPRVLNPLDHERVFDRWFDRSTSRSQ